MDNDAFWNKIKTNSATMRLWVIIAVYLVTQIKAYPYHKWEMYPSPVQYHQEDYRYPTNFQYYQDSPTASVPELEKTSLPYYYGPYDHFESDVSNNHEDRFASLPVGQETWFETEATPRWRSSELDDVNAAFLDNLILTQMAQDAQRRRENSRTAFQPEYYNDKDIEDEDVRELKALAGKPLYHVPKTAPKFYDEDYSDDDFINWNGNKRSVTTATPATTTVKAGDKEVAIDQPVERSRHRSMHNPYMKRSTYHADLSNVLRHQKDPASRVQKKRRIEKRFVAKDNDLIGELRGLKHHMSV